jgi:hypothetical protein
MVRLIAKPFRHSSCGLAGSTIKIHSQGFVISSEHVSLTGSGGPAADRQTQEHAYHATSSGAFQLEQLEQRLLLSGAYESNDTLATAYDLTPELTEIVVGMRNTQTSVSADIETPDDVDYYRLDLAAHSGISIDFQGQNSSRVWLLDDTGARLDIDGVDDNREPPMLAPGTYYLEVLNEHPSTTPSYDFDVTVMPAVVLNDLMSPTGPDTDHVLTEQVVGEDHGWYYYALDLEAGDAVDVSVYRGTESDNWSLRRVGTFDETAKSVVGGTTLVSESGLFWFTLHANRPDVQRQRYPDQAGHRDRTQRRAGAGDRGGGDPVDRRPLRAPCAAAGADPLTRQRVGP